MATIFPVIGAKGGVGTTTVAVDLTQALLKQRPTTIVDADFAARRSIAILLNAIKPLDDNRPEGNLASAVIGKGLTIVEMAHNIHASFTLKPPQVEALLQTMNDSASTIVLDAPQPFAAAVRPFIVRATRFILLLEPTLLGVTGARAMITELNRFGISNEMVMFVSNQREPKPELQKSDIEKALNLRLAAELPPKSDRRYAKALESLVSYLASLQSVDPHALQPSAATPLGDRRIAKALRRPGAAAGESGEGQNGEARATIAQNEELRDQIKVRVHEELAKKLDLVQTGSDKLKLEELRAQVAQIVSEQVEESPEVGSAEEVALLRQEIIDEALGFGPLEDLLRDPDVTEIMVNGADYVYAERSGKLQLTSKQFRDDRQLRLVIERMIAPIGRRIDESQPMVDARLPDGSRVNAIIEPLALDGPALTIRRFGEKRLTAQNLINVGAIAPQMLDFLRACVEARLNIVISGGTGSGKTTFLNILSTYIPVNERIVTIEDAAELLLNQEHIVRLEARPPNLEGRGEIKIRDLVRNSLRMRPDRIIVGECRGGEALDMLQAMNTGHDGSLTTVHANTPRDCISRIETMVLMSGFDLPVRAIREQISGAIDLIVQTSRMRDGSRKIMSITEVVGMEGEVVTTQEVVRFNAKGLDKSGRVAGDFESTAVQPNALKKFEEYGVNFDLRALAELKSAVSW